MAWDDLSAEVAAEFAQYTGAGVDFPTAYTPEGERSIESLNAYWTRRDMERAFAVVDAAPCIACGAWLERAPNQRRPARCCSPRCYKRWVRRRRSGARVEVSTCRHCGKTVRRRHHMPRPPRFCSKQCNSRHDIQLARDRAAASPLRLTPAERQQHCARALHIQRQEKSA